ncbi:MAG TPA: methionyl-tRNA formyltransferase [Candidatus Pullichristensenella excrementipullorum]|nr:methionyl-tRNA formyltransferase [Candidatus Pullichristensenella excrementipullorum]
MRVVFMGTPEFAVPSLKALLDAGYGVVGVFTQPDRPVGRGHKLAACPVKKLAVERGVPVYQFERLRNEEGLACLRALAPDIVVTAAFGQILSQALLDVPKMGTVNVHASLLPAYRGAAPINWCILNGETRTGVTTMLTDAGVDTGAMLLRRETDIGETETAAELSARLSQLGAELLIETLKGYIAGEIAPTPQDERLASRQPMLKKEMGLIDWTRSAKEIACQARGLDPWPSAYTDYAGGTLKIYRARPAVGEGEPGTVLRSSAKEGLFVACGEGALEVLEMQAPGGKRMSARAYLAGKKIEPGTRFGEGM